MRIRDGVDLVRAGAVLVGAGARLAWRRRRRGSVPASLGGVTPAWLEGVVAATTPGARVELVRPIDVDAGTTMRARLLVGIAGVPDPPATLFLKLAPPDLATAAFVHAMGLGEQEVRFYRELAPRLDGLVPRAWGTAWDAATGRFALLLADLADEGCELPSVASRPASLADAEAMMVALATLHVAGWDAAPPAWLRTPTRHRRLHLERALARLVVARAARRHADWLPPEIRGVLPRLLGARDQMETAWATGPLTVIHGDAHAGNTFRRPDGRTGLLDWQVVQLGQGMRDVTYFLCNSLPVETRRRHERDLVRRYLAELRAHGVTPIPFEAAWAQHRRHAVYAWIAATFTAGAARLQPEDVVRAGVERTSAAVLDLESLGALG